MMMPVKSQHLLTASLQIAVIQKKNGITDKLITNLKWINRMYKFVFRLDMPRLPEYNNSSEACSES